MSTIIGPYYLYVALQHNVSKKSCHHAPNHAGLTNWERPGGSFVGAYSVCPPLIQFRPIPRMVDFYSRMAIAARSDVAWAFDNGPAACPPADPDPFSILKDARTTAEPRLTVSYGPINSRTIALCPL